MGNAPSLSRPSVCALPLLWSAAFSLGGIGNAPSLSRPSIHWAWRLCCGRRTAVRFRQTGGQREDRVIPRSTICLRPASDVVGRRLQPGGLAPRMRYLSRPSVRWLWRRALPLLCPPPGGRNH